jgi:outer membrane protein assembly factor BamB
MKYSAVAKRVVLLSTTVLMLSSCSWGIWDFLRDSKTKRPDKLVDFKEEVRLHENWSIGVGDGQGDKFTKLQPVLRDGVIYAAGYDGIVVAVRTKDGRRLWKQDMDVEISGGVGAGAGLVVIGTENGVVYALDAATGKTRWKSSVSSEVLSAPATDGKTVVVQSIDGRITGLGATSGQQLWTYEGQVPALSVRGTSSPLILGNTVLSGQAGGSVIALALDNGTLRWEERVTLPKGKSDLDRLIDIDGDLVIGDGNMLLVPSYQGNFSVIDISTGQTRWRTEASSLVGASFGFGNAYIVSDDDKVIAYKIGTETPQWTNDKMKLRKLSQPLGFGNYLAVGDFEGYVHLLAQSDGRFVGRVKVDGDGVRSHLLAEGNTLYVFGNSGELVSYTVR